MDPETHDAGQTRGFDHRRATALESPVLPRRGDGGLARRGAARAGMRTASGVRGGAGLFRAVLSAGRVWALRW